MITMGKSTHGFPFLSDDAYGAPLGGPSGHRSSANKQLFRKEDRFLVFHAAKHGEVKVAESGFLQNVFVYGISNFEVKFKFIFYPYRKPK